MNIETIHAPRKVWPVNGTRLQKPQPHTEEVRASVRFPLHLPVRLAAGKDRWVDGTTQDISASGFLFQSDHEFAKESKMEFAIEMPAAVMGTSTDVVVHGTARVVRSYKKEPMNFAAAVIDDYAFESALGSNGTLKH